MSKYYDNYEDEFGNEPVKVLKKKANKKNHVGRINFDILLTTIGVGMALLSAFFPWYVFLNQEDFVVQEMTFGDDSNLPGTWQSNTVANISPQPLSGRDAGIKNALLPPDGLATASIPDTPREQSLTWNEKGNDADKSQPFPYNRRYRLLYVANDRALVEHASGIYIVKIGSVLPDNSKLTSIEKRKNGWALKTSTGGVLEN